jgi:hypothetical protein
MSVAATLANTFRPVCRYLRDKKDRSVLEDTVHSVLSKASDVVTKLNACHWNPLVLPSALLHETPDEEGDDT